MGQAGTITISYLTGNPTFDVYVCDLNGNNCIFENTIDYTDIPYTFDVPNIFRGLTRLMVKIIDISGCTDFQIYNCIPPTPSVTPSITPSPSVTPTITPTKSVTPTQTPTPTPLRLFTGDIEINIFIDDSGSMEDITPVLTAMTQNELKTCLLPYYSGDPVLYDSRVNTYLYSEDLQLPSGSSSNLIERVFWSGYSATSIGNLMYKTGSTSAITAVINIAFQNEAFSSYYTAKNLAEYSSPNNNVLTDTYTEDITKFKEFLSDIELSKGSEYYNGILFGLLLDEYPSTPILEDHSEVWQYVINDIMNGNVAKGYTPQFSLSGVTNITSQIFLSDDEFACYYADLILQKLYDLGYNVPTNCCALTPTPTPTNSPTPTVTPTVTPTITPTNTVTPTPTSTINPTPTPTPSITPTNTVTPTVTPTYEPPPFGIAYLFVEPTGGADLPGLQTYMGQFSFNGNPWLGMSDSIDPSIVSTVFNNQMNKYLDYSGWGSNTLVTKTANISDVGGGVDDYGNPIEAYLFQTTKVDKTEAWNGGNSWYTWVVPYSATNNTIMTGISINNNSDPSNLVLEESNNTEYGVILFDYTGATIPQDQYIVYITKRLPDPYGYLLNNTGRNYDDKYFKGGPLT